MAGEHPRRPTSGRQSQVIGLGALPFKSAGWSVRPPARHDGSVRWACERELLLSQAWNSPTRPRLVGRPWAAPGPASRPTSLEALEERAGRGRRRWPIKTLHRSPRPARAHRRHMSDRGPRWRLCSLALCIHHQHSQRGGAAEHLHSSLSAIQDGIIRTSSRVQQVCGVSRAESPVLRLPLPSL